MADDSGQPGQSGDAQRNPWAPPEEGVTPGKGAKADQGQSGQEWPRRSVAEQPTITSDAGAAPPPVPPAPSAAPGGPGSGPASGYASPSALGHSPGYGQPQGPSAVQQHDQQYGQQYGASPYGSPQYGQQGAPPYGYPSSVPPPYGYGAGPGGYGWPGAPLPSGKSVAAMVLGIISMVVVCSCWGSFLGIITSPIALGLGISARRGAARGEHGGRGQAVAGLVMGILGTVLSAIIITIIVLVFTVFEDDLRDPDTGGGGSSIDARGSVSLVVNRP